MPKSAAERKRKQRQKLKDGGNQEQFKANDGIRKREKLNSLTDAERQPMRQKDKERKAKAAQIRAEADGIAQEVENASAGNPFKSPRSLAKARKIAESNLPKSSRKKCFLLKYMCPKNDVVTKLKEKPGPKPLSAETTGLS